MRALRDVRVQAWAAAAGLVTLTAWVAVVDPHDPGHFPACPFRAVTGWSCPGCGSLRTLHDLTTGHAGEAWGHNAALIVALPLLAYGWLRAVRGRGASRAGWRGWMGPAVLVALVAWTVLRNLPPLRGVLAVP